MMRLCLGFGYSLVAGSIYPMRELVNAAFEKALPIETYAINYPYNKFYMRADYHDLQAASLAVPVFIATLFVLFAFYRKGAVSPLNGLGLIFILLCSGSLIYRPLQTTTYFVQKNIQVHTDALGIGMTTGGCPSRFD